MEAIRSYRDLKIWQQAIQLAPAIYDVSRRLPPEEKYALGDQLRRAVVSVAANIAEGQSRRHTSEFLHFLSIAQGSVAELDTLLTVAELIGYFEGGSLGPLRERLYDLSRAMHGLTASLKKNPRPRERSGS